MCKISIIIPIYNAERFIERCVNSILAQSLKDFELILVDDGSKDDSLLICKHIAQEDERIIVFHKENGGASSARKYGVEHSSGEFVMFVDADDTLPSDAIYNLYSYVEEHKLDIAQGERRFIPLDSNEETTSSFTHEEICCSFTFISYLFSGYTNCGPFATLYKRCLFDDNTFDLPSDVKLNEDFYMNLCLGLKAKRIGLIKHIVYNYYENASSVTHNYLFESLKPQKHLYERIKTVLLDNGVFDRFAQQYYKRLIHCICSACFHNRELLKEPYSKESAVEAKEHLKFIKDKCLCYFLIHPCFFSLLSFANKIRQLILGYNRY